MKSPSASGGGGLASPAPGTTLLACPPWTEVSPGVCCSGVPSVVSVGGAGRPRVPLNAIAALQTQHPDQNADLASSYEVPSNPLLILVFGLIMMDVNLKFPSNHALIPNCNAP